MKEFELKLNAIRAKKPPNNQEKNLDFLISKVKEYESLMIPPQSEPYQIMLGIENFNFSNLKGKFSALLKKNEDKIIKIQEKLTKLKKGLQNQKNVGNQNSIDILMEGLNSIKRMISDDKKLENVVYSDKAVLTIKLPVVDIKAIFYSMIQAESVSKALLEGIFQIYRNLSSNLQTYKNIIQCFPTYFKLPQEWKSFYDEILNQIKNFYNTLKTKHDMVMDKKNFEDIKATMKTLGNIIVFFGESSKKAEDLQGFYFFFIYSLFN